MSFIFKEILERLIDPSITRDSANPITLKATGPGELDKWLSIMEGQKNSWRQRQAVQINKKKKKIIFSNWLMSEIPPTELELILLARLIENYEVYLWPGSDIRITECKPVQDANQFWAKRSNIYAATEQEVDDAFAQQGLTRDDYCVLDYHNYNQLLRVLSAEKIESSSAQERLDLSWVAKNIPTKELTHSVHFPSIKCIETIAPNNKELEEILINPELKTIIFKKISSLWFVQHLTQLLNKPFTYSFKDFECSPTLLIPNFLSQKLVLENVSNLVEFGNLDIPIGDNTKVIHLEHLEVKNCRELTEINLKGFSKLKSLTIHACSNLKSLDLLDMEDLEELIIVDGFNLNEIINLESCKNLKRITLVNCYAATKQLDLSSLKKLETIKIDSSEANADYNFTFFPNLKELTLQNLSVSNIDLTHNTKLKELTITNCQTARNLILPTKHELEKVVIAESNQLELPAKLPLNDLKKLSLEIDSNNFEPFYASKKIAEMTLYGADASFKFEKLNDLAQLENLTVVAHDTKKVEVHKHPTLTHLNFSHMNYVTDIHLSNLAKLSYLEVVECRSGVIDIHDCPQLKSVALSAAETISLAHLENLEHLSISGKSNFSQWNVSACAKLKSLKFTSIENLENLFKAIDTSEIVALELERCSIAQIDLTKFPKLRDLKIISCSKLKEVQLNLANLENLEIISTEIAKLEFDQCPNLKRIKLESNKKLTALDLSSCAQLESVNTNSNSLSKITLKAPKLKELALIEPKLAQLTVGSATELKSLVCLAKLKELDLSVCENLLDLVLYNNADLTLSNLEKCPHLRSVTLELPQASKLKDALACDSDCVLTIKSSEEEDKDLANLILSLQNQKSNVSRFNLRSDTMESDGKVEKDVVTTAESGNLSVVLNNSSTEILRDHYRIFSYNTVEIENDKLIFKNQSHSSDLKEITSDFPPFDDTTIIQYLIDSKNDPELVTGFYTGDFKAGIMYPLPNHQAESKINFQLFSKLKDTFTLFYDAEKQLHYIKANKDVTTELFYTYKQNLHYDKVPVAAEIYVTKNNLLSDHMRNIIFSKLEKFTPLNFFFSDISINQKLQLLAEFCSKLNLNPLAEVGTNNIDTFFQLILEQTGECRHRSQIFMLLSQYLNVSSRMIVNEDHAYVEIPYLDNGQRIIRRVDMGGSPTLDLTPITMRENVFDNLKINTISSLINSERPLAPEEIEDREWELKYYQQFSDLVHAQAIDSVTPILPRSSILPPLIKLEANQDPFAVYGEIIQALKLNPETATRPYLYINDPKEFSLYLKPYSLKDGKRIRVAGPLKTLIEQGGTLVVNWSNFTPTQIASYKSILDKKPTLLGADVSPALNVISLSKKETASCSAFLSRCKPYSLNAEISNSKTLKVDTPFLATENCLQVNLFGSHNWREQLLGKIKFAEDKILLNEGLLISAIKNNQPIIINNPPKQDKDFLLLISRIKIEKKILFNGDFITVPDDFKITLAEKSDKLELPKVILSDNEPPLEKQKIYINLQNFHELMEQLQITADKKASTTTSLLNKYLVDEQVFYITDSIPESDWQILLADIKKHYPEKKFEFALAPGAEIENVLYRTRVTTGQPFNIEKSSEPMPSVFLSDDPDMCCNDLINKLKMSDINNCLVIDVGLHTTLQQLIAKIKINTKDETSGKVEFSYQEKGLLAALKQGQTVILNGIISPSLYQQLLPLLEGNPPYIYSNGERIEVKGKLFVVMPQKQSKYKPITYGQANYSFEEYRRKVPKAALGLLKEIEQFYNQAKKLPHSGPGRPKEVRLPFARIKRMIQLLQDNKLHKHNPIKGAFHYDYPKQSEDYAYLNVVAKYIFCKHDQTTESFKRLNKLLVKFNISQESDIQNHVWKILNCFRGADLYKLLGADLNNAIDNQGTLSPKIVSEIWLIVAAYLNNPVDFITDKSHVAKRNKQLHALIETNSAPLLVLKGAPGVGKTYAVRELKEDPRFAYYEGMKNIIAWLEDTSNKIKILLLDEANMADPDTLNFLKGLQREQKEIYYKGKVYPLNNHIVIATTNPEDYPRRHYHSLFQDYAETLLFAMPEEDFFEKKILYKILREKQIPNQSIIKNIIKAYKLIEEHNPTFAFSTRDMENLARRFLVLAENRPDNELHNLLCKACISEFAGTIKNANKRQAFIQAIYQQFQIQPDFENHSIHISNDVFIPAEKSYLVEAIEEDLKLRNHMLSSSGKQNYWKQGILIDGAPGVGKSTIMKAVLEKIGFSKIATDGQRKYYEISVSEDTDIADTLIKAFHEGAIVVMDELNLDESILDLIHHLLEGEELNGKKSAIPGFMIFASQNPGQKKDEGRKATSQSIRNRMHVLYMEDYSSDALYSIANDKGLNHPRAYVKAYEKSKSSFKNEVVNTRTFYTLLNVNVEIPKENIAQNPSHKKLSAT